MNPIYVPLLSALAGALIGSLTSIATIYIQGRTSERRERIRQASTMAMEQLKLQAEHAPPGTGIFPISIYLHNQLAVLDALEKNKLTPDRLREIAAENQALIDTTVDLDRQFRNRPQTSS